MHISFDIDGVLANFHRAFGRVLREHGAGVDIQGPDDCKAWGFHDWMDGITREAEAAAWDTVHNDPKQAAFWADLVPLVTSDEVAWINRLAQHHIVSFITTRPQQGQHENVIADTRAWLKCQGIRPYENVYAAEVTKGRVARLLGSHLHIDDNGDNVIDLLDHGVAGALLRRPYNVAYQDMVVARGGYVVSTLGEFLGLCTAFGTRQDDMLAKGRALQAYSHLWNSAREQATA
jgi:hypothetical protein